MAVRTHGGNARVVAAFVVGLLLAGAPQVAIAAYDAVNSDKVDGKHAVGATATPAQRAGKLVATNSGGRLPNDVIAKAPNADRLDNLDASAFERAGGRSILVRGSGSALQNGEALRAALAAVQNPGPSNVFELRLEPGIFDLGGVALTMRSSVHIVGSGKDTVITCACGGSLGDTTTLFGANATLRRVTVTNSGYADTNAPQAIAVNNNSAGFSMEDVSVHVSGATVAIGVTMSNWSGTLRHVSVDFADSDDTRGITVTGGSPKLEDVTVWSNGVTHSLGIQLLNAATRVSAADVTTTGGSVTERGLHISGGTAAIRDSIIAGVGIQAQSSAAVALITSQFDGWGADSGATMKCVSSFASNYGLYTSSCF